jgi:DNA-binding response OmpR family regulator
MRALLGDFLSAQGYQVTCFKSAVDAVVQIHQQEVPDIVVSDVRMNPMNGISFLRIAKRDHPELPILLYTGGRTHGEEDAVLKLGAAFYLVKPFSLTVLKDKIELCLSRISATKP